MRYTGNNGRLEDLGSFRLPSNYSPSEWRCDICGISSTSAKYSYMDVYPICHECEQTMLHFDLHGYDEKFEYEAPPNIEYVDNGEDGVPSTTTIKPWDGFTIAG